MTTDPRALAERLRKPEVYGDPTTMREAADALDRALSEISDLRRSEAEAHRFASGWEQRAGDELMARRVVETERDELRERVERAEFLLTSLKATAIESRTDSLALAEAVEKACEQWAIDSMINPTGRTSRSMKWLGEQLSAYRAKHPKPNATKVPTP